MPEKKTTTKRTATTRKRSAAPVKAAAAAGDVASGRGSRPRRPTTKARQAAASYETRLPATSPAAAFVRAHRGRRKSKVGRVVSAKMPKTVIVEITRLREHPLYKKVISVRKKFPAHDQSGDVKAGDLVRIQESRPFSATKRWQVVEVISRAGEAMAAAPLVADVEKRLEETAGVTELLSKPVRETPEPTAEQKEGSAE